MRWCKAVIAATPAVRLERIAPIRTALNTASYYVSADDVAIKMIERSLVDTIFSIGLYRRPWP